MVILEENYVKNGFRVLKAVFNTTVLETAGHNRRNLSVTCINDELGTSTTIVMEVAGIYIISAHISAPSKWLNNIILCWIDMLIKI